MRVVVQLFGRASSQSGEREASVEVPEGATLRDVATALVERFPALEWVPQICRPARNLEYARWPDAVADGDEVSFIPPVSGGGSDSVFVEVTDAPLDPAPLVRFAEGPEMGAVVTFSGNVRDHNRGRRVEYLEYDVYRPMAEAELRKIALEAVDRWKGRVAIQHRVGRLEIGEPSVLVVAACAHRGDAFDACRYAIDTLKERVPIWKREVWEGGEVWIEGEGDAPVAAPKPGADG
jgi:molybdopterin synthase catalytic subunit/molybdopterin converting factor small subunit